MKNHIVPVKIYLAIFIALAILTALTTWIAFVDLGALNTPVAVTIAIGKALLVILYFMHVRYSDHLTWVFVAAGFFWLAILIALTMSDFISRGWLASGS